MDKKQDVRKRVFMDEIGKWPKVYNTGPGRFEVVARHKDPRRIKRLVAISYIPAALFGIYLLRQMTPTNWGFIVAGAVLAWLLIFRFFRAMLTDLPFLVSSTTRITFDNGQIKWEKFTIGADMRRQFRSERHKLTASDIRNIQKSPDRTFLATYSQASTVYIDSGEGLMDARAVASIANDETGELAHLLATRLRFVDKQSRGHVQEEERGSAKVRVD